MGQADKIRLSNIEVPFLIGSVSRMAQAMMLVKRLRAAKGIETRPLVGARRTWLLKRLLTAKGMMIAAKIRQVIFGLR